LVVTIKYDKVDGVIEYLQLFYVGRPIQHVKWHTCVLLFGVLVGYEDLKAHYHLWLLGHEDKLCGFNLVEFYWFLFP
jgi:hypothetical protein